MTDRVRLDVTVDAPVDAVFAAVTDWPRQGDWMLGTRVEVRAGDGCSVGSELAAWTGLGVGVWDTMVITRWEAPYRVDVLHTGAVVRGTGTMEVVALPGARSRFIWSEELDLPLGMLGALGWPLARPILLAGVRRSLRVFAHGVESGAAAS
ncbi:MAG TPA: polyketide cyclase [Actinobacteria bacterium]|jgi:hypothetical protein|nr:polyketide cyclase [Actinomycetota bacterium]